MEKNENQSDKEGKKIDQFVEISLDDEIPVGSQDSLVTTKKKENLLTAIFSCCDCFGGREKP